MDEPLPTKPDPDLICFRDDGGPGAWIVVVPIALAVLALVRIVTG